jgi:translation initiation factor 1
MGELCQVCGLPKELCACENIAREQQLIVISSQKRRYGKVVTIVEGVNENDINIDELARTLKTKCAAGGTAKDGRIELQGEHRKKVEQVMKDMGFQVEVK